MIPRLKQLRKAMGKSREEVARDLGVAPGTLRNWEQGRTLLRGDRLVALADYYGLDSIDQLYYERSSDGAHGRLVKAVSDLSEIEAEKTLDFVKYLISTR